MEYNSAFRTAVQLTAVARVAADEYLASLALAPWFPRKENYGLNYEFNINQLTYNDAATFRTWDATAPFGSTPATTSKMGKLPPISRKLRVSEADELQLMNLTDAIGVKFEDYAHRLGLNIAARVALAQGDAVNTGKVTLQENGLNLQVDFGRAAGHTVSAATAWSTASAPALTDLLTWKSVFVTTNGYPPEYAVMSTQILTALQKNTSIIQASLESTAGTLPTIITIDRVRQVFSAYGFGEIVVNDDQVSVDGTLTRLVPSDKLILLPAPGRSQLNTDGESSIGSTQWGIPAEAINGKYGIPESERVGIFSGAFQGSDPEGFIVLDSAVVLPTLSNANGTFAADVL